MVLTFKKCVSGLVLGVSVFSMSACSNDDGVEQANRELDAMRAKAQTVKEKLSKEAQDQVQNATALAGQAFDAAQQQVNQAGAAVGQASHEALNAAQQAVDQAATDAKNVAADIAQTGANAQAAVQAGAAEAKKVMNEKTQANP